MSLRHPLANVKGLGSSGEGSRHWWSQRLTAILLIPLTAWFTFAIVGHINNKSGYEEISAWIAHPGAALFIILYLAVMFYHAQLGLQVVIEDYIHLEGLKIFMLLLCKCVLLLSAMASIFSVLKIAL